MNGVPTAGALDEAPESTVLLIAVRLSPPRSFTSSTVPVATTSTVAAILHTQGCTRCFGAIGITPRGASSSAVKILDEAAMNPRASATAA